jgi:DNA-binding NarL/FixJ family response regulator
MPSRSTDEGSVRVLIADDHRLFAELLMAVLSEDGRVDVVGIADDGAEVVDLALELRPDVILMDVNMPMMNGLEATRRIRGAGLTIPIVLLTGTEGELGSEEAIAAGATAFLRKQRGVDELRQVFVEVASLAAVLGASSG